MSRALTVALAVGLCAAAFVGWRAVHTPERREVSKPGLKLQRRNEQLRQFLFDELQPVKLMNCDLERFGEAYDGGYLLCANLLGGVQSGYSYGISGYDGWGCHVSRRLKIKVHQYDCFDLHRPVCEGGDTVFHGECVAGSPSTDKAGRSFETPQHQFAKNGDAGKHLVMKMDVEGAEWDTFLAAPDSVFEQIDQMAVEFHGANQDRFAEALVKLKGFFYIANLHFNNYGCVGDLAPFPAWAY